MRSLSLEKSPYFHYLEPDENFRRWVEALECGSMTTASVYFWKACYACEELKTTPEEVVAMDAKQAKFYKYGDVPPSSGPVSGRIEVSHDVANTSSTPISVVGIGGTLTTLSEYMPTGDD